MKKQKKLLQTINNPVEDGIFHHLYNVFEWLDEDKSHLLDTEYYLNHSGDKVISNMYSQLLDMESKGVIVSALSTIASVVKVKYKDTWDKLHDAIYADYNPIDNYSMTEQENVNTKVTNERNITNELYGFNTPSAVPNTQGSESVTTSGNKDDNERSLTRRGNIGVTTSQQMIESEIKLREFNLYTRMMNDVDMLLTKSYYGSIFE